MKTSPASQVIPIVLGTGMCLLVKLSEAQSPEGNTTKPADTEWVDLLEGDSLELREPGPSKTKRPAMEIGDRWSLKDGEVHLDRDAEVGRGAR